MLLDINEFQTWAFGDTLDNTLRAIIGEFIVLKAVHGQSIHRTNWDGYDILMADGTKIEVKTSGYLQSWNKSKQSTIEFKIKKKNPWIANENRYLGVICRYADVWVFAIHREQDLSIANALDTDQWEFLVTSSRWLDDNFGNQKDVRYSVLNQKGLEPVGFEELAKAIEDEKTKILHNTSL